MQMSKDAKETGNLVAVGTSRGVATAAMLLMAFFLASRLLGFVRQAAITATFGIGPEADAWFAAFRVPDTLFALFAGGALVSAIIPVYTEFRCAGDRERANKIFSGIFNSLAVFMIVAGGLGSLFADSLTNVLVPGFDSSSRAITAEATRWLMISPLLLGLGAVAKGVLQSERRFLFPALGPIFYNLGTIFGALFLADTFGIMGLVWGTLLGAFVHALIQFLGVYRVGICYMPWTSLGDPAVRRVLQLMLPRLCGFAVVQISFVFVNFVASFIGASSVAALATAWLIVLFPLGVFAIPFAEASLPTLSSLWIQSQKDAFRDQYLWALRIVLFLTIPASIGIIAIATPLLSVLFQRGEFGAEATALTSIALIFYSVGLIGHAAVEVLTRAFFSMQDTKTPVCVAIASLALHMLLSWLFSLWWGIGGLALGVSIGVLIEALGLYWLLDKRLRTPGRSNMISFVFKIICVSCVMAIVIGAFRSFTWPGGDSSFSNAIWLGAYVIAGTTFYVGGMFLLDREEAQAILMQVKVRISGRNSSSRPID